MGWFNWGGAGGFIGGGGLPSDELPEIFPLGVNKLDFIRVDVETIYSKILIDVLERTYGLTDDQFAMLWDNCLQSECSFGLITLLARAMFNKSDLFVVYEKALNVVRLATGAEQETIRADYKKEGKSSAGVYISFRHHNKSDMIRLYSGLEYITVSSLHKTMNVSKAVQIKISDLRGSVGLNDSTIAVAQAKTMARSLCDGKDLLMDGKDTIETSTPDLTAINAAIEFLDSKRSFYLGLPAAYINGEQTTGMGTTGENDTKAIERGLKNYFYAIVKPVVEALFGIKATYKSQDFRNADLALNVLKTFQLTDNEFISAENKQKIINQVFELPEDAEGDGPEEVPGATDIGIPPNATGSLSTGKTGITETIGKPPAKAFP